jgi:xylulose-5-phosphate/fructose-6-phosphate phosphoketolase
MNTRLSWCWTPPFPTDTHIVFAFHGYLSLIHRLTYRRQNREQHVRGYNEATVTTEFDIRVQNKA